MSRINQQLVLDLLNQAPNGLPEDELKSHFSGKNFKKIVDPMLSRNELTYDPITTVYSIDQSYIRQRRTTRSVRRPRLALTAIAYPRPIVGMSSILEELIYGVNTPTQRRGITLYPNTYLVELTANNKDVVESCIPLALVSTYNPRILRRKLAGPYPPHASTVYFSYCPGGHGGLFPFSNRAAVLAVVLAIDEDNSTFDARVHRSVACNFFTDYILDPTNTFVADLDGNSRTVKSLPDKMVAAFLSTSIPGKYRALSLASKICKYLHEWYYGHDKFFIYDSVVRKMLPFYLDIFNVPHAGFNTATDFNRISYSQFYDYINSIYSHCSTVMSKSELDHIMWYCYRNWKIK